LLLRNFPFLPQHCLTQSVTVTCSNVMVEDGNFCFIPMSVELTTQRPDGTEDTSSHIWQWDYSSKNQHVYILIYTRWLVFKGKTVWWVITGKMGRRLLNRYHKTRSLVGLKQTHKRTNVGTFSSCFSPYPKENHCFWNAPRVRPFALLLKLWPLTLLLQCFFFCVCFFTATPVCTFRGGNVAPRTASVSACKLVRQEQFLYFPILKCMYLNLLQINFYKKKKKKVAVLVRWNWLQEVDILGENHSQCHFAHHKYQVTWPRLEHEPLLWKAGDWQTQTWNRHWSLTSV
jgi:hypothetical protein